MDSVRNVESDGTAGGVSGYVLEPHVRMESFQKILGKFRKFRSRCFHTYWIEYVTWSRMVPLAASPDTFKGFTYARVRLIVRKRVQPVLRIGKRREVHLRYAYGTLYPYGP